MAEVEPFHRGMVEAWAKSLGIIYATDDDGDILMMFEAHAQRPFAVTFMFVSQFEPSVVYGLRSSSEYDVPPERWGDATLLCNSWNRIQRFPKAYLETSEEHGGAAWIRLEYDVPLNSGAHQQLVDDVSNTMLGGTFAFWEWALHEQGFTLDACMARP